MLGTANATITVASTFLTMLETYKYDHCSAKNGFDQLLSAAVGA